MFLKLQIKYVIRFQITGNMSSATSNKPAWTPGDEPSQKDLNLLNQRVIQFTATQAITLTGWFYLVFHAYTTIAAGSILGGFAYGLAAFAGLFAGLTIARLFKN